MPLTETDRRVLAILASNPAATRDFLTHQAARTDEPAAARVARDILDQYPTDAALVAMLDAGARMAPAPGPTCPECTSRLAHLDPDGPANYCLMCDREIEPEPTR